jgi:HSP20 family protein
MANITRPFSFVPMMKFSDDIEKELNRLLGESSETQSLRVSDWQPKVDIIEEEKQFIVKIDIPGVKPEDIEINLEHNIVTVRGERESENKEKKENFVRYERSKGSFYRQVMLPENIDIDKITAQSKHGVLEIVIPKNSGSKTRKIKIES